jgi:hypothetical protein
VAQRAAPCTLNAAAPTGVPIAPDATRPGSHGQREPCRLCAPGALGAHHAAVRDASIGMAVMHAGASLMQ